MKAPPRVGERADPILSRLDRIAGSAWFAYGSILLIQAKVIWGIWDHRDLSAGDTSNYFVIASWWSDHLQVNPLFSPLYTSFWGTLRWFIDDTYAVTITHRVIIVIAVTIFVLIVLRRLLSPAIAWLIAVWWAIQPLNYDTLNEVHLFSLLPVLVAALVALRYSGVRMRAAVFGILLGAAVLQRNELVVAAAVWLLGCLAYELHRWRTTASDARSPLWRVVVPFGLATVVVALLGLLSISRSPEELSAREWVDQARYKQDFALCQHYAVGYQQRHRADGSIGWRNCFMFMERDFGSRTPSITEALAADPGAIGTHFRWNLTLFLPYSLQLALFDRTSGSDFHNPDYVPVATGSKLALVGSVAITVFVAVGLVLLWRRRRWWWENWFRERVWGWALLGAVAAMGVWVAITTHPRPSYLFPLNLSVMAVIGASAMAIAARWPALARARAALPVAVVLLVVLLPARYEPGYSNPLFGPGRGASEMVSRLQAYADRLAGSETVLLGRYSFEACNYVVPENPCVGSTVGLLGPEGTDPLAWLDRQRIDVVYVDEPMLEKQRPVIERLLRSGWEVIGPPDPGTSEWLLLGRSSAPSEQERAGRERQLERRGPGQRADPSPRSPMIRAWKPRPAARGVAQIAAQG